MLNNMLSVFAVAVALGADAFSIALGLGLSGTTRSFKVRFVGVVAILHVMMPLIGLEVGAMAGQFLGKWAAIIGAVVLAFIGVQMLKKGFESEKPIKLSEARQKIKNTTEPSFTGWMAVIVLGLSVSIDALTVGFGLGTARVPILYTVITTGFLAGLMTAFGWLGAKYFSEVIGRRAQIFGGLILTVLAVKMLL